MIPINFPPPEGFSDTPIWNGHQFLAGDKEYQILEYSENFAGWSDDLTTLHEEVAGNNHPIDVASRMDAISQIKLCSPDRHTVIMEVGCSSGFLLKDLVKFFPNSVVLGADVVKEPLYKLAKILPTVPLMRFDLLKCPLPKECIDILIMLNVLEHIDDDFRALKNAFNLLKPGGRLIIEVPAGPTLYDSYDAHLQHFRRYSANELTQKLIAVGFKIDRRSHLGFLLFPAFAVVKYLNKFFPNNNTDAVVRDSTLKTGSSTLVNWAMKLEAKYLARWSLPFGIRILVTMSKPMN